MIAHLLNIKAMLYKRLISFMRFITFSANIVFFLWILYNGMFSDFDSALIRAFPCEGLMVLLVMNCILLMERKAKGGYVY